ncbi:hypothetical protein [Leifsonia shinshuensis]|uniref:Multisubunit Na+/H+ antiporter MnhE subunit n=1 Tax=Leifsonia shinshuensis TaxID=150026 RepID=A0A853CUP3_9MICO|nr:hypothetical protein [Leifsonia shinshuensis]NYJ22305.1 multisubunit Na+/H+ antiporter MnhE subunit [Leifsonia shinshuensis]
MRAFIEAACWFVAGMVFWMATVSAITLAETIVAVCTSVVLSVFAVVARRAMGLRFRPSAAWLRWALLVPVAAAADLGRLFAWIARGARDPVEADAIERRHVPAGDAPEAVGHRAAAIIAVSATPGSCVIDARDDGAFLLHRLVGGPPSLDERVSS